VSGIKDGFTVGELKVRHPPVERICVRKKPNE